MKYSEYNEEGNDLKNLETNFIPGSLYEQIHENSIIVCHDVFIACTYKNVSGLLLVKRLNEPAKDIYWPIGGRIQRGIPAEESLKRKTEAECGLEIDNIHYLGVSRTYFNGEPFGHNHGTDTLNLVYFAEGKGELILDNLHSSPIFITKKDYLENKYDFVPYVDDYLKIIIEKNLW